MDRDKVIARINRIKNRTGWSQELFAQELGVTFAAFNRWLNQGVSPRRKYVDKINELFKQLIGQKPVNAEELSRRLAEVDAYKVPELRKVIKANKEALSELILQLIYHTISLEGIFFTLKETRTVAFDKNKVKNKSLTDHVLMLNLAEMYKDILLRKETEELSDRHLRVIHRYLLRGISDNAGRYTKETPDLLGILRKPDNHLIHNLAEMYVAILQAAPFEQANSLVACIMVSIVLLNNNLPPLLIRKDDAEEYANALEHARNNDYAYMTKFFVDCIENSLRVIARHFKPVVNGSVYAQKVGVIYKPIAQPLFPISL